MDDQTLLALCIHSEAAGEPLEGKQAVARVVLNRTRAHYMSDGTIPSTILWPNQFSAFYFAFEGDSYVRVCHTLEEAAARAETLLEAARKQAVWGACLNVAARALADELPPEPLLVRALLYLNPAIVRHLPDWATPDKELCAIGRHQFYAA